MSVNMMAGENLCYTLTPASGSNNNYAGNCDIIVAGITWNLTGNSTMQPWRIGGKSLSNVDRTLYSKTPITNDISKIEVTHGTASSITVNSFTILVASDADFNNVISTLTPSFKANDTMVIVRPNDKTWENAYYKFIYNVSVSGKDNKFIQFTEAKFYTLEDVTPTPQDTTQQDTIVPCEPVILPGVEATMTCGENAWNATVNGHSGVKIGTGSKSGEVFIQIPAHTNKLHILAAAWNKEPGNLEVSVPDGITISTIDTILLDDANISGNSNDFTLKTLCESECIFNFDLTGVNKDTVVTFTRTGVNKRFVIWGATYETEPSTPTGIENVKQDAVVQKQFNGTQVIIIRDGKTYNILGQRL